MQSVNGASGALIGLPHAWHRIGDRARQNYGRKILLRAPCVPYMQEGHSSFKGNSIQLHMVIIDRRAMRDRSAPARGQESYIASHSPSGAYISPSFGWIRLAKIPMGCGRRFDLRQRWRAHGKRDRMRQEGRCRTISRGLLSLESGNCHPSTLVTGNAQM
jgi:hypothetical protein